MTDICGHCADHDVQLKGFISDVLGSPDRPSWNLKNVHWPGQVVAEPTLHSVIITESFLFALHIKTVTRHRSFGQPCKQRRDLFTIPLDLTTPEIYVCACVLVCSCAFLCLARVILLFFGRISQILFAVHKSVSRNWARRMRNFEVIKRGVGVGLRNAGCGVGGWRWVCTREMCTSHLKSDWWFVGWVCSLTQRACSFQVEGPGIYPQH